MVNEGLFSSESGEWETPQELFDRLDIINRFTLDVRATADNAKCRRYYSLEDDGLLKDWEGVCWMNPPYGREIGKWIKKAYDSSLSGVKVVGLLPARTDTAWFHEYIYMTTNTVIEFLRGRLKFSGSKNSAPFPSMVVTWYPRNWIKKKGA